MLGGVVFLPRTIDKMRAYVNGTVGEYNVGQTHRGISDHTYALFGVTVAQFERAARLLGVTASAVSQRVKLIEERLGAVLIVRGQPCTPTQIGARLCRHADLVRVLEADLRQELSAQALDWPDAARG